MRYFKKQKDSNYKGAFGELVVSEMTPIIQVSNQYRVDPNSNPRFKTITTGSATIDNDEGLFRAQTGVDVNSIASLRTDQVLTYRPGQGATAYFTAGFSDGTANSRQFAGLGSETDQIGFGYDGTDFVAVHQYNGQPEIQQLEISAGATGNETATITLDDDEYSISLVSGSAANTAKQISDELGSNSDADTDWETQQVDNSVYIVARQLGDKTGTFSFSSDGNAAGSYTEVASGADYTKNNTAQSLWSVLPEPFPGFDPTKLQLYRVQFGYLGAAGAEYSVYDKNKHEFRVVHRLDWAGENIYPFLKSPDMNIRYEVASEGSISNLSVRGASAMAGVEGQVRLVDQTRAYSTTKTSISTTLRNIITLRDLLVYSSQINMGAIIPVTANVAVEHNKPVVIEVYKNATVTGEESAYVEENVSIAEVDTTGTTLSGGTLVDGTVLGINGRTTLDLKLTRKQLSRGDSITIAAKTTSGTATSVTVTLVWLEDR